MLFPALLELTLHNIDFEWSTAFLNMLSPPILQALSIRCQPGHPLPLPIVLHALCLSIAGLPSAKAITGIYIIIGGMIGDDSARISDTYEIYWSEDIAPLFALTELRGLTVTGQCVVVADDCALATMSQNWSQLVILVLDWAWNMHVPLQHHRSPEDEDFPRATAWGLLQLARGCPRLFRLTLAVDLRLGPLHNLNADLERTLIPPVPLYGDAVSELVEFQSKGSLLSDTLTVASFLSLVFPGLQTIHNPSQEWLAIDREHKRLVRVRAQEREFGRRAGRQYRLPDVIV
ncbi:uncharacterized protein TRAVEDRAFT_51019 [Trametes versicolor FP-101664 SS1]|uniref:uncharacterized protein n=1 Tax=Trametes versicolor (strain FP-101664) TaxID=717944 RepID=UPI000462195B|nr:uncharacterized protein TRAVEDRAFT_51019 [Trametes versicolor FP-101664 SS1]EIW54883.1 hypothetical protein TRAVEDRAFT_51019 [Trametes versicolor FP-101664 SS1]